MPACHRSGNSQTPLSNHTHTHVDKHREPEKVVYGDYHLDISMEAPVEERKHSKATLRVKGDGEARDRWTHEKNRGDY
jgi:hypothetical protein